MSSLLPARPPGINPGDSPWKFDSEVAGLLRRTPPRPAPVVCVGSSSFTMWYTLDRDLGGCGAINHGFGGCEIADCIHFSPVLVTPYTPRVVILCAGDNDLGAGKAPAVVLADFAAFTGRIWAVLPRTHVLFVAIKPSLARWTFFARQTEVNESIRAQADTDPRLGFIDIRPVMLGPDQHPRPELFVEDGLHLSPAGYAAWASVIRPALQARLARV